MSSKSEFMLLKNARIADLEFTFEVEALSVITKRKKRSAAPFSIHPEHRVEVLNAAVEAFKNRYPVNVFEDEKRRIVKITKA